MTDEQINVTIAKACPDKFRNEDDVWFFQYSKDCWSQCHNNSICTDLNAMHEAEKVLTTDQFYAYSAWIDRLAPKREYRAYLGATARQRAEAFLRTLGKWKKATDKKSLTVGGATTEQSSADQKEVQK